MKKEHKLFYYIFLGFILYILLGCFLKVFALDIVQTNTTYGMITDEFIYNKLFNNTGYNYSDYSNISVKTYISNDFYGNVEVYACQSPFSVKTSYGSSYYAIMNTMPFSSSPCLLYRLSYQTSNGSTTCANYCRDTLSLSNIGQVSNYMFSWNTNSNTTMGNKTFTNYDLLFNGNNYSYNNVLNKLDFTSFIVKYVTIQYLDSSYHVINSVDCHDNNQEYCTLNVGSNGVSYINVIYYLNNLFGGNISMPDNKTYQLKTYLLGANNSISANLLYSLFETTNGDVFTQGFTPFNQDISFNDNLFSYKFNFNLNSGITAPFGAYQFQLLYKTNGSSFTSIGVPFSIGLFNITDNNPIITPTDDGATIDPSSIIISQNDTLINQNTTIINNLSNINNSITDYNTSGGTSDATSYFSNFNSSTHGLSGIITIPLGAISSISSATCTPIQIPFPHSNEYITLPCMTPIYNQAMPSILNLWQIVSFGIIAYFICLDIFRMVKNFKDPDNDKIEVVDL